MRSRENCRLLAEWLKPRYEVVTPGECTLPEEPFDLCIVDGPCLETIREAVEARKRWEAPAYLPFLFVTMRKDLRLVTRFLYQAVDELIFMPIEKVELDVRLDNLLRARRDSVALKRQSQELFTGLVEQSLVGVYLGRDGSFFYYNRAGADMFGYDAQEIVEKLGPLDLVHPDDRDRVARELGKLERREIAAANYAYRGQRKDGTIIYCEAYERLMNFEGRVARLGTVLDVTERHLLEQERQKSQQAQIDGLVRADELKNQFLGILSHELRTPLNAILGFGSVLQDEVAGELRPMQHEYIGKMLDSADVLLALINDLLDMSRIQAGKFALSFARFRLERVVEDVMERLETLAELKAQDLALDVADDLPEVEADPQRIAQVLTNLIGNAIKFTKKGGHIQVSLRKERKTLLVEVADTGIGIRPQDLERLFQPFSQLDMSNTRAAGGTGLGLSISKAIVEAHGGHIGVRSSVDEGSTFWFTLPLS